MALYKRCSRCGKRLPYNGNCSCSSKRYKDEDIYNQGDKTKKFYKSRSWQKAREQAIAATYGLDIYSLYELGIIEYGATVHHIIPIREDWDKRNDINNLIYLTDSNHQLIHALLAEKSSHDEIIRKLMEIKREFSEFYGKGRGYRCV